MRRPIVAIALCSLALGAPTPSARVTEVRVGAHPTFTRVVFELDGRAGYQIETREGATGRELVVTLQAASAPKRVAGHGPLITRVDVEPSDARAIAHVRLRGAPASVKELLLANPPRIVLDFMLPAPVAAATKPVEAKPAPAPEPPVLKPVAKAEPGPTPAPPKPIAKAEPKPAAKPVPAPEPIAKAEPQPVPVPAKPVVPLPAPKPVAKLEPVPVKPVAPEQVAKATPPGIAPAPVAPVPGIETPTPVPQPPAPAMAPKPSAKPPAPVAPVAGSPLDALRKDPMLLTALGAAVLVLLLIAVVVFVRRRSQRRTALDALESQRVPEESSGLGPFGMDELPSADAGFDGDRERPTSTPMAGPGLFDDDDPEKESEMEMGAQVSSGSGGLGTARAGADSDVARLVRELEKRMGQIESRLDEANAARERLERQVTAQSEELRVQRAAIARTQRALRGMSRGGEEQATEPALRDPSTPSRT